MDPRCRLTPARPIGRAGVVLSITLLLLVGCRDRGVPEPRILVLGADTIILPDTIGLVDVRVGGEAGESFDPASPTARVGDIVRFISGNGATHAVAFDGSQLHAGALEFLEGTGQLRGPPLLTSDAAWILSLDGAPPGGYPFTCLTHGTRGRLTVSARVPR